MPRTLSRGALEAAGPEGIAGWAWDPARPYDPVEVELLLGGAVVARACADRFAMELARDRIGNGMHAFRVQLDRMPEGPYPVAVTARIADGGPDLAGRIEFASPAALRGVVAAAALQDFEGTIDRIIDGRLCGWVWNRAAPDTPVTVALYDGARHVGDAQATLHREDLAAAGKADGHCAFSIDLPLDLLDGNVHSLHVRVCGNGYELANSPLVFGPNSARQLIELVVHLRQEVEALSHRVQELSDPARRLMDDRLLAGELMKRTEAMLTIQREALEREMRVLAERPRPA